MKYRLSLKLSVALAFLLLAILLVIGYSMLSVHYFIQGMDNSMLSNMEQAALSFVDSVPEEKQQGLNQFSGYAIAEQWQNMPYEIQSNFTSPPQKKGVLYKYEDTNWLRPPDAILFVMRLKVAHKDLYISRRLTHDMASPLVGHNVRKTLHTLITISVGTAASLALIILLLTRRFSRPVAALGVWARQLSPENLNDPIPDFSYADLNQLAELIRSSSSSVHDSLEREHRFLRHISHELRTPISVIRNNMELMHRLEQDASQPLGPRQKQVVDRVDRASLTMQHVTETLLWLSRQETEESLPQNTIDLEQLIQLLVAELSYLSNDAITTRVETAPCLIRVSEPAARIVLSNLLRNAFQHTYQGTITITQTGNRVEICNFQESGADHEENLGFGLGLQLTAQLTAKLGWDYKNEATPDGHQVLITLGHRAQT
nr:HAMP domain-containing sensor histidine kinase [uncultured Desulfuromonas sp.]